MFLWIKAFHLISMVAWFAGLFYLPRLFVYHVDTSDAAGRARFQVMERRLYTQITWPAGVTTTLLGFWLLSFQPVFYLSQGWMQLKLGGILLLWAFHLKCGYIYHHFDRLEHSARYYRVMNEFPTLLLIAIVLLAVVR